MNATEFTASKTTRRLGWTAAAVLVSTSLLPLSASAGVPGTPVTHMLNGSAVQMATTPVKATPATRATAASAHQERHTDHRAGFLGVSTTSMSKQLREHFGAPPNAGVLVSEITPDSAASAAGLRAGDVIVGVDERVIGDGDDLRRAIHAAGANTTVRMQLLRDGRQMEIDATLGESRQRQAMTWTSDGDAEHAEHWERFGERMAEIGERFGQIGEHFGEEFGDKFSAEWEAEFEANGEEFERKMEAWGEQFGQHMERWGEEFGRRMEERFESGEWDENSFNWEFDSEDFDNENFAAAMEEMQRNLEALDLSGINDLVREAMEGVNWEGLSEDISRAMEDAHRAAGKHHTRDGSKE